MAWPLTARFRVKKAMPPLTGLSMLGSALATKLPHQWRSGRRRGTGDRVEPVPPSGKRVREELTRAALTRRWN